VAPGNAPASPIPNRNRTTMNDTALKAPAVAAVMIDQ